METSDDSSFDPTRYWRDRASEIGHTGWKRPVVYVFDQLERLALVEERLQKLSLGSTTRALDFGCGSGDFSRMLLRLGFEVTGVDPFMSPKLADARFQFATDLDAVARAPSQFDLILSVTVLDHVLPSADFEATLDKLAGLLSPGGKLVLLEYAPDSAAPSPSPHQAYRPLTAWVDALTASGLRLEDVAPVAHPSVAPSSGYRRYRRRFLTRVLGRVPSTAWTRRLITTGLSFQAKADLRRYGLEQVPTSPLKLLTCSKVNAA